MHEHILRTRVDGYSEGDLHRHLHGIADADPVTASPLPAAERTALEHFHPRRGVLSAFPLEAWPYLQRSMGRRSAILGRWAGKLTAAEKRFAREITAEIAHRGPLSSDQIDDDRSSQNGWTNARFAKVVMDKLFAHGRLLIARRINGRRVYDLPEKLIPAEVRAQPRPTLNDEARWTVLLKLRQHRLVTLTRGELPHVSDVVQPISVENCPPLYCLQSDLALLEHSAEPPATPRLLAPLDPLIIDRKVTSALWDFDYTWEVYTPAAKRKRGYYALPLLAGDRLVGHADLKADRPAGKLRVISRRCARGHRSAPAVTEVASFLGLR